MISAGVGAVLVVLVVVMTMASDHSEVLHSPFGAPITHM